MLEYLKALFLALVGDDAEKKAKVDTTFKEMEEEAKKEADGKTKKEETAPSPKTDDPNLLDIKALQAQIADLNKQLAEKSEKDRKLEEQFEQKRKADITAKVDEIIKKGKEEKKIPAQNEEYEKTLREIGLTDVGRLELILSNISGDKAPAGTTQGGTESSSQKSPVFASSDASISKYVNEQFK